MSNEFLKEVKKVKLSSDPDHTKEAQDYYDEYYSEELGSNDFSGKKGAYRGETFISLNTILGVILRLTPEYTETQIIPKSRIKREERILALPHISHEIKEKIKVLSCIYHSKANFIPLYSAQNRYSINKLKNSCYKDYPDLFLRGVQKYYETGERANNIFSKENTAQYFSKWETFEAYIDGNFLQAYVTVGEDGKYTIKRFSPKGNMPYNKYSAKK